MKDKSRKAFLSIIALGLLVGIVGFSSCQKTSESKTQTNSDPYKENIKKEAEKMGNLMVTKDYKNFIKYMYPPLINLMGGEERILSTFEQGLPNGSSIEKITISDLSDTIQIQNQIQCTLKEEITMKVNGGKLLATSTLIGLSEDNGKTWYFLDSNGHSLESLKEKFPNISDKLTITENEKPTFISE